jgi:uncharacterized protein YdaU (DUF1376 family)
MFLTAAFGSSDISMMSHGPHRKSSRGDYGRDTAHLSLVEDGAYRRLLDYCYSTGKPIPAHVEQVFRICRAFAAEEQAAVKSVLAQFFSEGSDGFRNHRVDQELAKSRQITEKRVKAGIASAQKRKSNEPTHVAADALTHVEHVLPQPQPQPQSQPKPPKAKSATPARAFQKPGLEEVADYCRERGNQVDPQQWIDHYSANGWKVGRSDMKDWKAAIRTWEKNGVNAYAGRRQTMQDRVNDSIEATFAGGLTERLASRGIPV